MASFTLGPAYAVAAADDCKTAEATSNEPPAPVATKKRRIVVYGTVLLIPKPWRIDFGEQNSMRDKARVCPRMVLVCSWMNARLGFVGGKVEDGETLPEAMTREWAEETGDTTTVFTDADHWFTHAGSVHTFVKVVRDASVFDGIVSHGGDAREAYVGEIFGVVGLPIVVEGPTATTPPPEPFRVYGLPRYLANCGGAFEPSGGSTRQTVLAVCVATGLLSEDTLRRIEGLAKAFCTEADPIGLEALLSTPGSRDLIGRFGGPWLEE